MPNEPTARWIVPLHDGNRVVEFEHGTASGKRVVRVNGKTIINREWMFRLVGDEEFMYGDTKFTIRVDPIPGTPAVIRSYSSQQHGVGIKYILYVNGSEVLEKGMLSDHLTQ
ncbi:Similar to Faim: Fas apoptotic inhibitory molecule 1 (Rattus norvegicus) [Cotesia congregata]|uniref:Similar to Faim: Fas apoptotic inhibitory molecule 1 (Rattus norvegicus) n=1 Tax=Cotesia congregata TaxID=51543 RepID=A0A8J2HJ16_COTCN|nr:Similar to Faim: Fas apoptotic inhibitory molecule 1 (Rattus norvegicus) [Cotesia congregata]